ncbi:hypothetical protein QNM34_00710 [Rahnella bonaserana]|uniref:hypothetical protein n=1 Tax=Rahnella bonaserana TaxID=2816248 RepID=UPI0024C256EF|nr:hypothetical protein [Rahnella bonaserana]WHZ40867.1 hypothetical protein QNM34_00710 [Rahnella bonaserana]
MRQKLKKIIQKKSFNGLSLILRWRTIQAGLAIWPPWYTRNNDKLSRQASITDKKLLLEIDMSIKPGPKPIAESTGKEDKRQRVTPENKPKHPDLKEHNHKKGE